MMYALPVDAQGMIGYSREHERLQPLLEYIKHFKNVHSLLTIYEKPSSE